MDKNKTLFENIFCVSWRCINDAKNLFLYDLFKRRTSDMDFNAHTNRNIMLL